VLPKTELGPLPLLAGEPALDPRPDSPGGLSTNVLIKSSISRRVSTRLGDLERGAVGYDQINIVDWRCPIKIVMLRTSEATPIPLSRLERSLSLSSRVRLSSASFTFFARISSFRCWTDMMASSESQSPDTGRPGLVASEWEL